MFAAFTAILTFLKVNRWSINYLTLANRPFDTQWMHHLLGCDYYRWAILKTTLKTLSINKIRQVNPRTWQHLGRAKITNQTPSPLPLGTQTALITPEHADTCAGGKTNKKATECGVQGTRTCTRYFHDCASLKKYKRFTNDLAVFLIKWS